MAALKEWGLLDRLLATGCPGIDTYVFDFGTVTISGAPGTDDAPLAYAPRRTVLDKLLVDAATEAGAELREGFTVDDLAVEDGRITGIRGHGKGEPALDLRARVVVGADGHHSLVARLAGAEPYNPWAPRLLRRERPRRCAEGGGPDRRRRAPHAGDHRSRARQRLLRPPHARGARGLTSAALALVLASAALHAGWNALVAGARDTHATTAVALVFGALAFAIPAALTWRIEAEAWPYIIASAVLELVYFALLAAVYSRADYSVAYPIARGSAPVIVLLISVVALGVAIGLAAALGILAVTAGVLLVRGIGSAAADSLSLLLALAVGTCIAGYTLVDDHGVRHAGAIPYFEVVLVLSALPYAAAVAVARGTAALKAAADLRAPAAGAGMVAAYLLVLAALERAEAAPIAALRETSVVMAAAGAAILGRESVPARRIAGAILVVAGVAAIAL